MINASLQLVNFQKAVYNWINKICAGVIPSEQIVWRNQSEPLPPRPCVTMKITDGPKRTGYGDNLMFVGGPTGTQYKVGGQRTITVSIQIFGNTSIHRPMAYQLAVDLGSSLSMPTILDQLRGAGISVHQQGDPINITALEETEYEERAQFDVLYGVAQNVLDDPGIITSVGVIGQTIDPP